MSKPFAMVEKAVREFVETSYEPARGHVGGDPSYEPGDPLFVWLSLIGGSTDEIYGDWSLDVDVLGSSYAGAMQAALDLEALLIGSGHVTSIMRIDNCIQNEAPSERPWDDDSAFRIGAVYTFTARRTG